MTNSLQFLYFLIFISIIMEINILKAFSFKILLIKNYLKCIIKIYNYLYLNIYFLFNKIINIKFFNLYIYININRKFIIKFKDRLLIFSWVFSNVLQTYAFYNINLGLVLRLINIYLNSELITYIYTMNFLIGFVIYLILLLKLCDKENSLKTKVFKFMLYVLLSVAIGILFFVLFKLISHIFVYIGIKLVNILNFLKNSLNHKNNNPQDPDFNAYYSDSNNKKKKTNKYLQQRAQEMREKLLFQQKSSKTVKKNINFNQNSLSAKRGINKKIYIEPKQNLNIETQLERIKNELEAYNIQQKKFEAWSKGKGKDFTYPDEAKELFKEYSLLLKDLRPHLKSMKKKMKNSNK